MSGAGSNLVLCTECGWTKIRINGVDSAHHCDPASGKMADALAGEVLAKLGVRHIRNGYGTGVLSFEFDENTNIRFKPDSRTGKFAFEDLFWLDDLTGLEVFLLVDAIRKLRQP